jgi:CBS-domain-containing membrane protein
MWPESASELYRPSDRRLSAKLVPTLADRGCHVVSVADPNGRILRFLDRTNAILETKMSVTGLNEIH